MKKTITLLSLFLASVNASYAQIPNGGFENWTPASGYSTPDNWDNLNTLTSAANTYTCEEGTSGAPAGSKFLKLTTKMVTGIGTIPALVVCGKIDLASRVPKSGFPIASRPASITGKWQYMANGIDAGYVGVWLTKWNTTTNKRDTIATKVYSLPGMEMAWKDFDLTLIYVSGSTPDSAIVGFSASGPAPVAGSYLWVDDVAFAGTAANVPTTTYTKYHVTTYPNPTTDKISLDFGSTLTDDLQIMVTDVFGRTVKESLQYAGQQIYTLGLDRVSPGIYFVKIKVGEDVQTQRIVVQ